MCIRDRAYVQQVIAAFGAIPTAAPALPDRPVFSGQATGPDSPATTLTNREIDVLLLLAERLSDKDIAERLVLAPVTAKKHTLNIYRKLGVHNRRAAVQQARRLGLI